MSVRDPSYCEVRRAYCNCTERCDGSHVSPKDAPQVPEPARAGGETSTPPSQPAAQFDPWYTPPWRGSVAEKRANAALATKLPPPKRAESDGPDPMLIMKNPSCSHDRCCYDIATCVECRTWCAAHWADRIDVGSFGR